VTWLVDTNVISEIRKGARCDPHVMNWWRRVAAEDLFLSVLVLGEIRRGITQAAPRDPAKAATLEAWLTEVTAAFGERILPVDAAVARCCARLHVPDRRSDRDALIAATGIVHAMTVVTRNVVDFEATGVDLLNPWSDVG
jgi:predicted nucleic acid-binding protein